MLTVNAATPEAIALALLEIIRQAEGKCYYPQSEGGRVVDRDWILDTYAACLHTVRSPQSRVGDT